MNDEELCVEHDRVCQENIPVLPRQTCNGRWGKCTASDLLQRLQQEVEVADLASVHALCCNEELFVMLVFDGASEGDLQSNKVQ